jgi:GTP-binding protein
MLKIKNASLAASAVRRDQYPGEPLPMIALFGRSNAGKSSLINTLINRRNLARTSSAPGKTRLLNFYRVDAALEWDAVEGGDPMRQDVSWYFVDLPGYGYAKVSKSERAGWLRMMDEFLPWEEKKYCWQLADIRHLPSAQDVEMHQLLEERGLPYLTVANKIDKVSRNACAAGLKQIAQTLQIDRSELVSFSAVTKEGREQLLERVEVFLSDY